jgi:sulfate adenylyltransferase large subunit
MTAQPKPGDFVLDAFLHQQDQKSLLRFVACGSVDHGKSTLIGRLLYESKLVFDDQLDALKSDSRKYGTQGKDLDFALLLDGLAAEREQKITIDVAYRFFTTERRKFIVADAPGHEQYTRNMATGASTADLALILVNAQAGLTRQTKRHSLIVSTLGVRHLVVAVNKMDLVGWSQEAFAAIEAEYRRFAAELNVREIVCIPMSARDGDNVVARSQRMDWYRGPTLLEHLEQVEPATSPRGQPFRMPVQLVNRPSADFRGYSGLIANGDAYVGMPVRIMPSERLSSIDRIVTFDGDVERAAAGQSVTITLGDEVDASRGDVLADAAAPPAVTDRLAARVVWMGKETLAPGRRYLLKLGTCTATATVEPDLRVLDLDTRASVAAERLSVNDIGDCVLHLDRLVAVDPYTESRETGSFILIDRESFDTVGMGFVEISGAERAEAPRLRKWWQELHERIWSMIPWGKASVRTRA